MASRPAAPGGSQTRQPMVFVPTAGMAGQPMAGMPMGGMPMGGMPMGGMPMGGMPMGGMPMGGMPMGGMPMAGMPMAGMPMAGMPMAGMPMAGMPMAGGPLNAQRGPYVQMPTPGLTPSAVPRIPGCPAGLEYLAQVDHLLVHQRLELMEMLVPFETKNKYVVKNTMGQFVFMAIEDSDLLSRCFCGSIRPFQMSLLDYRSVEVLRLFRPLRCDCCLCFCCLQEMDVQDASGATMGSLRMECTMIYAKFSVLDSEKNVVLLIKGPLCTSSICCNDVVFDILATDGVTKLGAITKVWTGMLRETFSDADNFAVTFPLDLDVKIKAVLIGAVFLIDFMFFESGAGGNNLDCPGNLLN
ncbi:phospholipid scramblase 2-like isoform X1 [Dermacentor silvarum]|uniref:phospholipid scramblase 2-like isoform X1 n=1 Tax=Dermacentor silvarum TaxID=543639 RepID=UPI002101B428|nr:phospholipid scramblase 2-like isoform X1 [Dermacentor silvarum]